MKLTLFAMHYAPENMFLNDEFIISIFGSLIQIHVHSISNET